jgi:hypothetical protein
MKNKGVTRGQEMTANQAYGLDAAHPKEWTAATAPYSESDL